MEQPQAGMLGHRAATGKDNLPDASLDNCLAASQARFASNINLRSLGSGPQAGGVEDRVSLGMEAGDSAGMVSRTAG